jgi:ATP-binding protein involved in chromosome partitioning
MSYFIAPNGDRVEIFGHGGGRAEAARKKVSFLGEIPIYVQIREGGDAGSPVVAADPQAVAAKPFIRLAEVLRKALE